MFCGIFYTIFSFYNAGGVQALYDTKRRGEIYPIIEQQFGKGLADKARLINESTPTEIQQRILDTSYWEQFTDELSILIDAHIKNIRTNRFTKIACFTEDVQSQYMWDNYAAGYTGFALEYDFRSLAFRGCEVCHKVKECDEYSKSFTSIYPVIYSETRYNATDSIINLITNQILQSIISTKDLLPVDLLHWYKAHLYKGRNGYAQEKESSSFINKTSFIENCETSAVGRALGMCGFGIDTSIASYEEVQNAINNQGDKKSNKTKEVDTNQVLVDYATVKATMDSYGIDFREKLNDNILKATKLPTQDITQLDPQQIATLVKYYNALVKKFKQQKGV